jgi:hypothetical protein
MSESEDELLCDLHTVQSSLQAVLNLVFYSKAGKSVYLRAQCRGLELKGLPKALRETTVQIVSIDGHHIHGWGNIEELQKSIANKDEIGDKEECVLIVRAVSEGAADDCFGIRRSKNIVTPHTDKIRSTSRLKLALDNQGPSVSQSFSTPFHATGYETALNGGLPVILQSPDTKNESLHSPSADQREKTPPDRPVSAKWAAPRSWVDRRKRGPRQALFLSDDEATKTERARQHAKTEENLLLQEDIESVESARRYNQLAIEDWQRKELRSALRLAKKAHSLVQSVHFHAEERKLAATSLASTNGSDAKKLRRSDDSDSIVSPLHNTSPATSFGSARSGESGSAAANEERGTHSPPPDGATVAGEAQEEEDYPLWYHADMVAAMVLISVIEAALGKATESRKWEQTTHTHLTRLAFEWLAKSKLSLDLRPVLGMSVGGPRASNPLHAPASDPARYRSRSAAQDDSVDAGTTGITSVFAACCDDQGLGDPREVLGDTSSLSSNTFSTLPLNSTDSSASSMSSSYLESATDRATVKGLSRCFEVCVQVHCKMQLLSRALSYAMASVHLWEEYFSAVLPNTTANKINQTHAPLNARCDEEFLQRILTDRSDLYYRYLFPENSDSPERSPLQARITSDRSAEVSSQVSQADSPSSTHLPSPASSAQPCSSDEGTRGIMRPTPPTAITTTHAEHKRILLLQQRAQNLRCCATAYDQLAEVTAKVEAQANTATAATSIPPNTTVGSKDSSLDASLESLCMRLWIAHSSIVIAGRVGPAMGQRKGQDTSRPHIDIEALQEASSPLVVDVAFSLKVVARYLLQQHTSSDRHRDEHASVTDSPGCSPKQKEQYKRYPEYRRHQQGLLLRQSWQYEVWQKRHLGIHDKGKVIESLYTRALRMIEAAQEALTISAPTLSQPERDRDSNIGNVDTLHTTTFDDMQVLKQCSKLAAGIFRDLTYYYYESSPPDYIKSEGHKRAEIKMLKELARFYEASDPHKGAGKDAPSISPPQERTSAIVNIKNNVAHSLWGLSHIVRKQGTTRMEEARHIRLEAIRHLEELVEEATATEGARGSMIKKDAQETAMLVKYLHKWRKYHEQI